MLFNSYTFILVFLPVTLIVFYLIGARGHHRIAVSWLVAASLFFYGWWNPAYLGLILGSMLFNYAVGVALGSGTTKQRKGLLAFGVAANLVLIGYYKYANFFVDNLNRALGSEIHLQTIILPLAISFFTFQQIAYLVDAYKRETREYNFLHYCLFVTFFPQLIAGPIVHHKEMLPQFANNAAYKLNHENIAVGITIFILGLFKKVVLADNIALYATPVFDAAEQGVVLTQLEAWGGVLAYTLQLYFDFSGYSDMAIGLARMFGIRLPLNFNSPYKADNIIGFWRCWHMTLSRFLRDYLYIPLGGNRRGRVRRYVNLMITMLLGGLWHGAGWTFVMWGALHGIYLVVNHQWHALRRAIGHDLSRSTRAGRFASTVITFLAVAIAWAFFRAETFQGAMSIVSSMFGARGASLFSLSQIAPSMHEMSGAADERVYEGMFHNNLADWGEGFRLIFLLLIFVWWAPNVQQIMYRYKPAIETYPGEIQAWFKGRLGWRPTFLTAFVLALMSVVTFFYMSAPSEFLYFQF
jgi:D-alanyl-lipoteichoic acid acyltransferase DltB (MBOAT superfamily)